MDSRPRTNSGTFLLIPKGICPPDIHAPRRIRELKQNIAIWTADVKTRRRAFVRRIYTLLIGAAPKVWYHAEDTT